MLTKLKQLESRLEELHRRGAATTETVDVIIEIAEQLVSGDDPARLAEVMQEARELTETLGYEKGKAYCLLFEGLSCCFTAKHEAGLENVTESRAKFESLGDDYGATKATFLEANLLRSVGSFDQALRRFYKALEYFKKNGPRFWEANCQYDMGLLYQEIADYEKALDCFRCAIDAIGDPSERWLEGRVLNGMGTCYKGLGDPNRALEHHDRSIAIFRDIGHRMGEARVLDDIGSINFDLGETEAALGFHENSLRIRRDIGQRRAQGTSLLNMARVYLRMRAADSVLETAGEALAVAEEIKSKPQVYDAHLLLSQAYELKGDSLNALEHHKQFQHAKEQVFNDRSSDRIHKLHIAFEVEKAEKAAEFERSKNVELSEKNERLEHLLTELRETQTQLIQAEKMAALGKLVAGLAHEINTPLGASQSAIDVSGRCIKKVTPWLSSPSLLERALESGDLNRMLERILDSHRTNQEANQRISRILTHLKGFLRLDGSERQDMDVHEGLESALALLEHAWRDRIEIHKEYGKLPAVNCCPGEMNQVFMTILSNAVESIDGTGDITIRTSSQRGSARIEIADNGAGIPPERLQSLFDPGFTRQGARVKAGMGLMAGLYIVQKHGGQIDVHSDVGKGTTFTLTVPLHGA